MIVTIRRFEEKDIPLKVQWINEPKNNKYLHYDLPLREDKTLEWFRNNSHRTDRFDATIEADGVPVGLIGLLGIDNKNHKAEYYIMVGDRAFLRKGVGYKATRLLLMYAFETLNLNKVFLFTEYDNLAAQGLFEKTGFIQEGLAKDDLFSRGRYVSRYMYGLFREDYMAAR